MTESSVKVPWWSTQLLERCWCRGYGNGCGLIRSLRTCQCHAIVVSSSRAWQWTSIRRRIILGSNYKKIQVVYMKKAHTFYNLPQNFSTGLLARVVFTKKIGCIPGSLSLSLSPPLEERARGEVGGSWTLIESNHLTAIFGQHILYPAGIQIVISSHRTVYSHPALFPLLVQIHSEAQRLRPDDIAVHVMGPVPV